MTEAQGTPQAGEPAPPEPDTPPTPVELAAAEVRAEREAAGAPAALKRSRGRPRGSRDSRKRRPRHDRPAGSPAPASPAEPAPEPPAEPTEAELRVMARLCAAAWSVVGRRFHRRDLEESEAHELAGAAIPVIRKYAGPAAEKYGAEITLAMVVWGLWNHTALPAPAAPESEDEATGRGASE